jgi:hypothetical protein
LDISDDNGVTWFESFGPIDLLDHTQIFTGPPTEGLRSLMQDYPNVVYICENAQICQKSLDGGITFGPGVHLPLPAGLPSTCFHFGLRGVVGHDGTVYVPSTPCEIPYIGISHDEGATWQLVQVANTSTIGFGELSLGKNEDDNLFASWVGAADRLPYLAVSCDHGVHWSAPLMIGAPGVNEAAEPQLVVGVRGQVAVSYYGSRNSPGAPFPPACVEPGAPLASGVSTSCAAYQNESWNTT